MSDLCKVLGLTTPAKVAERLDDGVSSIHPISDSMGRTQHTTVVSEAGMYEVVIRSDRPEAVNFRRWITGEVLPAIRRTGGYNTASALKGPELLARAVLEAAAMIEAKDKQIAELEPKALVADRILNASGDMSVRDTAQALTRAGIRIGQNRLFKYLESQNWISRAGDKRYRVMQWAIERGWMSVLPQSHWDANTGRMVLDAPQPRVTMNGFQRLLVDLSPSTLPINFD